MRIVVEVDEFPDLMPLAIQAIGTGPDDHPYLVARQLSCLVGNAFRNLNKERIAEVCNTDPDGGKLRCL